MIPFDLGKARLGMSRDEVVSTFGEPDLKGGTSRKYQTPSVFRYGRIEFLFQPWKSGGLFLVQEVDEFGSHIRILLPPAEAE